MRLNILLYTKLAALVLTLAVTGQASAQCAVSPERLVIDSFMALDPGQAEQQIRQLALSRDDHPLKDFYMALSVLVRAFKDDATEGARRPYEDKALQYLDRAVKKSEQMLQAEPIKIVFNVFGILAI